MGPDRPCGLYSTFFRRAQKLAQVQDSQAQDSTSVPEEASPEEASGVDVNPLALGAPSNFRFWCYDTPFNATIIRDKDDRAQLTVSGDLGHLPYSAESPMARQYLKAVVRSGKDLPHAEISLTKKQSIEVRGIMNFDGVPTKAVAIAATAVIVIAAKPLVDLVAMIRTNGKVRRQAAL